MNKKLIFLRNGIEDFKSLNFGLEPYCYCIDNFINAYGYNKTIDMLNNDNFIYRTDYVMTSCPTILDARNDESDNIWWNEEEHKFEIFFVEDGKLKNISEYTTRELRKAHNIEKLYLNGGLDD